MAAEHAAAVRARCNFRAKSAGRSLPRGVYFLQSRSASGRSRSRKFEQALAEVTGRAGPRGVCRARRRAGRDGRRPASGRSTAAAAARGGAASAGAPGGGTVRRPADAGRASRTCVMCHASQQRRCNVPRHCETAVAHAKERLDVQRTWAIWRSMLQAGPADRRPDGGAHRGVEEPPRGRVARAAAWSRSKSTACMEVLRCRIDPQLVARRRPRTARRPGRGGRQPDAIAKAKQLHAEAMKSLTGGTGACRGSKRGRWHKLTGGGPKSGATIGRCRIRDGPKRAAMLTESVTRLIDEFAKLPGIGKKSAERLAYHVLRVHADRGPGPGRRHPQRQGKCPVLPQLL